MAKDSFRVGSPVLTEKACNLAELSLLLLDGLRVTGFFFFWGRMRQLGCYEGERDRGTKNQRVHWLCNKQSCGWVCQLLPEGTAGQRAFEEHILKVLSLSSNKWVRLASHRDIYISPQTAVQRENTIWRFGTYVYACKQTRRTLFALMLDERQARTTTMRDNLVVDTQIQVECFHWLFGAGSSGQPVVLCNSSQPSDRSAPAMLTALLNYIQEWAA